MTPLLEPRTVRIAPEPPAPAPVDRAPAELAGGTEAGLAAELRAIIGTSGLLPRASDLIRYASDASPYRRIPAAVVQPRTISEVTGLMGWAARRGRPLVFRSGGTSLNGQSQTDGVLVEVRRHWGGIEVLDGGARVRVGPGTVLGHVNAVLAPYSRRLGPDPASTDIATVGGVIANNSGGMRCGVGADTYRTLRSLTFALPSGTVIDTAERGAAERFAATEPELAAGLEEIRDEIRADADLRSRIARKFEIKNTMGYRLCAFLDADEPLEIFRRLLVGSEGTLAFIAEGVYETVPLPARTTLSWIHFDSIAAAVAPVPDLVAAGASAVELMVAPALMVAANSIPGTPEHWKELPLESAALLVELGAEEEAELDRGEAAVGAILGGLEQAPFRGPEFTRDVATIELYWRVREGLHGLIGRLRPPGTALIVEDVCVPPARIAEAAEELRALLGEHGFLPGVAGHASAGNLHFMLTPDFAKAEDRGRYEAFMAALVELVVDRYDGSLKAEHGTGTNMAPFVEREWGPKATAMMWRIKELTDPAGVLGPGIVLNRDPGCHLEHLKTTPPIEEVATSCVECGFCEPVCPSRDLTTTPRQRIVLRREMARQPAGSALLQALIDEYEYDGLQTCAADGTCATACPLGIDTGVLVKGLREREHGPGEERAALRVAQRWDRVEAGARSGLAAGAAVSRALGDGAMSGITAAARRAVSAELLPTWESPMPPPAPPGLPPTVREGAAAVYLPACINRIFGRDPAGGDGDPASLPEALVAVSLRAGRPLWIPAGVAGSCCGTPWASKGYRRGAEWMAARTVAELWRWSDEGRLPVVVDASSCTLGLLESGSLLDEAGGERLEALTIIDSIAWARDLLAELEIGERVGTAVVHPTCAGLHLGLNDELAELAAALADEVVVPRSAACCGFAGDRGFLHPELTAAATAPEAAEVEAAGGDAHLCSNRTCEIGMARAT
ncbi:MAG TPA: FAD-binding and (Fe-S)-binding domain-containing protein, partial [Solirubrobacterales bacterium]|nr:FAD-binding and (Fe-S)-binding domain-containing protein [Solirubrobacterales bacterium]